MRECKAMTTDLAPSTGPAAANRQTASTSRAAVLHRAPRLFGFVPSLLVEMARSPAAANAYLSAMEAPSDMRLKMLTNVTWRVIEKRGWLDDSDMNEFEQTGIERNQIYEIIALIAVNTISNYIDHIAHTQVEGSDE